MSTSEDAVVGVTITPAMIRQARQRATVTRRPVIAELEDIVSTDADTFIHAIGAALAMPVVTMDALSLLTPTFEYLSFQECVKRNCVIARDYEALIAVIADPFDLGFQTWLDARCEKPISLRLAHFSNLAAFFSVHESTLRAMDGALDLPQLEEGGAGAVENLSYASIAGDASPVVRLVNSTIYDALKAGASDIHLETSSSGLKVKYRIDGVLADIAYVPGVDLGEQVVSRIKVMAELDIAERRVPQDGRFKIAVRGHETDYRVSIMPNMVSEDVVIRILDKRALTDEVAGLRLDLLGFDPHTLTEIRRLAKQPYGMLLVTGPTGSGKTTSMYAALSEINDGKDKIITIEDPVEYQLPGVLQIPVNEKKGLTFARGLRSILRHDPDKILVGEIRDPETAQIAIQSALTGHLVLTSVHANNVFDVLGRFLHMDVDTYSFVSALNGIVAQRLLRVVCASCSTSYQPTDEELDYSEISAERAASMRFCRGAGCGACRGSGYRGRHAVGEVLRLTDDLRELIVARAPISAIKAAARENGTRFLREAAIDLAAVGKTTLEEVNRVTFVS